MSSDTQGSRQGIFARFENPGLSEWQARALNIVLLLVTLLFTGGWGYVVAEAARSGTALGVSDELATSPLSSRAPPPARRVLDRFLSRAEPGVWAGESGAVRALIMERVDSAALPDTLGLDSLPAGATIELAPIEEQRPAAGPSRSGAFRVLLRLRDEVRELADVTLLNPVPSRLLEDGRLGDYMVGEWPSRSERPARLRTPEYDAPSGLLVVTPQNRDVKVTRHLTLGDFLTKGQADVWPKYVAITPQLLDKVELTIQELERRGHDVSNVGVISGFRTPYYNAHGGNTSGRGSVSRHMYGDALDFYIDNDGDGRMDDLTGDGRVDIADARVIAEAAAQVEQDYPEYVGGIGVYSPRPGAHSGFVHVDARGYRARW